MTRYDIMLAGQIGKAVFTVDENKWTEEDSEVICNKQNFEPPYSPSISFTHTLLGEMGKELIDMKTKQDAHLDGITIRWNTTHEIKGFPELGNNTGITCIELYGVDIRNEDYTIKSRAL